MKKAPTFRHMMLAALVSAGAWIDASVNHWIKGDAYSKSYLFPDRDAVLDSEAMRNALHDALEGTPDEGSSKRRYYHNWKDVVPTWLETARALRPARLDELSSKYICFCGATGGGLVGLVVGLAVGVIVG